LNRFGCYPLWEVSSHLEFTITLSSNDLIPEQKYSKKQDVLYHLIRHLHDEKGLGYRKISYKLNSWGIKTPRGKKWFNTSVHSVLKRRKQRDFRIDKIRKKIYPIKISILKIIYTFD
jgi:predicted nucleic acid-binding protein